MHKPTQKLKIDYHKAEAAVKRMLHNDGSAISKRLMALEVSPEFLKADMQRKQELEAQLRLEVNEKRIAEGKHASVKAVNAGPLHATIYDGMSGLLEPVVYREKLNVLLGTLPEYCDPSAMSTGAPAVPPVHQLASLQTRTQRPNSQTLRIWKQEELIKQLEEEIEELQSEVRFLRQTLRIEVRPRKRRAAVKHQLHANARTIDPSMYSIDNFLVTTDWEGAFLRPHRSNSQAQVPSQYTDRVLKIMGFASAALRVGRDFTCGTVFAPLFASGGQSNHYGSMPARLEVPASIMDRLLNDNETLKGQVARLQSDMSAIQAAIKFLQQNTTISDYYHKKPKPSLSASALPSTAPQPSMFSFANLESGRSQKAPAANAPSSNAPSSNAPPSNAPPSNAPQASNKPPPISAPPPSDTIPAPVAPPLFGQTFSFPTLRQAPSSSSSH
ncbi:MAG: hypothetical protein Q9213_005431 [Squamulea squamosa]